jgi:hypothetical protein
MKTLSNLCLIAIIALLLGCTQTPKPVVLSQDFFVGDWERTLDLLPAYKHELVFKDDGTVAMSMPINPPLIFKTNVKWSFNQNQQQIILEGQQVYKIIEYTQNQFVWQKEGEEQQRFSRK